MLLRSYSDHERLLMKQFSPYYLQYTRATSGGRKDGWRWRRIQGHSLNVVALVQYIVGKIPSLIILLVFPGYSMSIAPAPLHFLLCEVDKCLAKSE